VGKKIKVGVISDTHSLLRPQALAALQGVDHIIHAGDIGSLEILEALRLIAPVTAVRGNTDHGAWARHLPETATLELGPAWFYVLHDLADLNLDPHAAGFAVVISGHTHQPKTELRGGVLFFNPGSAGPRRFHYPIALGHISVQGKSVSGKILVLDN